MKYFRMPKTTINKRLLDIQLNVLRKKSDTCTEEALRMLKDFEKWRDLVDRIEFALSDKTGP